MKYKKRIYLGMAVCSLVFAGCGRADSAVEKKMEQTAKNDTAEMFSDRDYETDYDEENSVQITLNGNTAECSSNTVKIADSTVIISEEGTYILSGSLENGMIIVDAEKADKLHLVMDGVSVKSDTSAALYIAQADKVFVTLAPESENVLTNGGEFTAIDDNNIDAAVFSKDDLTFNGQGSLTIESPAGHGIVSKDDLVVAGGSYTITSASHGISGKDSVRIADGTFAVTSGKDGIRAENTEDSSLGFVYLAGGIYNITADGDGISSSGYMQVENGNYTIQAGGGSGTVTQNSEGSWGWERPGRPEEQNTSETTEESVSVKAVKASKNLVINDGCFLIDSADDALHTNADLVVNGGTIVLATGDDGFHADGTVTVAGGITNITKSYEGIEGQNIEISGGTIDVVASDDGLNAAGGNDQSGNGGFEGFQGKGGFDEASDSMITISGGKTRIDAFGDGVDSNGSLIVSGGETYVSGPTNDGNGPLDYNGEATVTGGIFLAAGSSGMAQNFGTSSTQGAMLVPVGSDSENTEIVLKDEDGKNLLSWTVAKTFDSVVISCPEIQKDKTYTVTVGNSSQEITMDSLIYGEGGMNGGPGGKRPGGDMKDRPGGTPPERPDNQNGI